MTEGLVTGTTCPVCNTPINLRIDGEEPETCEVCKSVLRYGVQVDDDGPREKIEIVRMPPVNTIPWDKREITPGELQIHMERVLREILSGEGILPDNILSNRRIRAMLLEALTTGDRETIRALTANIRDGVFNYLNKNGAFGEKE